MAWLAASRVGTTVKKMQMMAAVAMVVMVGGEGLGQSCLEPEDEAAPARLQWGMVETGIPIQRYMEVGEDREGKVYWAHRSVVNGERESGKNKIFKYPCSTQRGRE